MKQQIIFMIMISASLILLAADKRPNISFILADNLGYNNLSPYGQKNVKAPCLDKMPSKYMTFIQHLPKAGRPQCY